MYAQEGEWHARNFWRGFLTFTYGCVLGNHEWEHDCATQLQRNESSPRARAQNGTLGGRRRLRVTETRVSVASERFPCVPRVQKKVYRPLTPSPANLKVIDGALELLYVQLWL